MRRGSVLKNGVLKIEVMERFLSFVIKKINIVTK